MTIKDDSVILEVSPEPFIVIMVVDGIKVKYNIWFQKAFQKAHSYVQRCEICRLLLTRSLMEWERVWNHCIIPTVAGWTLGY